MKPGLARVLKYGPWVAEAVRQGREPVQRAATEALDNRANKRIALEHAETLQDGTVMQAFSHGRRLWVVFTGDTPVATYPRSDRPLEQVIENLDLSKRQAPEQMREALRPHPVRQARALTRRRIRGS